MATAVVIAECIKLVLFTLFIVIEEGFSISKACRVFRREILGKPTDTLKLAVPAVLYFIQNNTMQIASANLPAAVYKVTYQGKTLVVAICSVLLLSKKLTRGQWLALAMMGSGLGITQISKSTESKVSEMANAEEQSYVVGILFVLVGCCCSGFAGVYFEKMIKRPGGTKAGTKKPSMWVRNVQLAAFSIIIGSFPIVYQEGQQIGSSLLRGFTPSVWAMVVNNALSGLLVALVINYANNILKGFSTALATILTCIVSVPLFGFQLSTIFFVGMLIIVASVLVYGGTIKLPGEWWNAEPQMCKALRTCGDPTPMKKSEDKLNTDEEETSLLLSSESGDEDTVLKQELGTATTVTDRTSEKKQHASVKKRENHRRS